MGFELEGLVEAALDAVEDLFCCGAGGWAAGEGGDQDDELVAAYAGEEIGGAELLLDAAGDGLQVEVADAVAVVVVDLFEMVEVDVEEAELGLG